jgi:hypothetical protein
MKIQSEIYKELLAVKYLIIRFISSTALSVYQI